MKWSELLWGRPIGALASVGLALAAFGRGWAWIIACAIFFVLHATVGWMRERSIVARLGVNYRDVLRRTLHLIADLADLSAGGYDLWMIELYLPRYVWCREETGASHAGGCSSESCP